MDEFHIQSTTFMSIVGAPTTANRIPLIEIVLEFPIPRTRICSITSFSWCPLFYYFLGMDFLLGYAFFFFFVDLNVL